MDSIKDICRSIGKKKTVEEHVKMEGDTLCIDCRNCMGTPEIRSPGCIRCIVVAISSNGNVDKIRLRAGRDTEISGSSAEVLCELAFIDRSALGLTPMGAGKECANCPYSCSGIFNVAWQGFPDPYFDSAKARLATAMPNSPGCAMCMQRTYRALEQAELGMKNVKKKVSMLASRGGV